MIEQVHKPSNSVQLNWISQHSIPGGDFLMLYFQLVTLKSKLSCPSISNAVSLRAPTKSERELSKFNVCHLAEISPLVRCFCGRYCISVDIQICFRNDSKIKIWFRCGIRKSFNSGNACYHSVQKLLSSRLPSKHVNIRIYKIIIFPGVLYGCETWSLTLRKENVFAKSVLRRIFGPKREVMGGWRKLHNEEFHNLYSSTNIIRTIR
jgi:hypothetical protein